MVMYMKKYIEITVNRKKERVLLKDIIYIETFGRSCHIHTPSGEVNTYISIGELLKQLDPEVFLHCHRSYIVNMHYVKEIQKDAFVLSNKAKALISRRMQQSVRKSYNEFTVKNALFIKEIVVYMTPSLLVSGEYNELRSFIGSLNERYIRRGFRFSLYVSGDGERSDDIEAINECDLFYIIYDAEPCAKAREDFDIAFTSFRKYGAPRITAYTGEAGSALADGFFSSHYNHIDILKINIVLRLKSIGLEHASIDFKGSTLLLEGKAIMTLDNIPVIKNSASYSLMIKEYSELETQSNELRDKLRENPDDEITLTKYLSVSGQKNETNDAMNSLLRDMLAMEASFLEKISLWHLSPKQVQARKLFESGDMKGAKELLDLEEMALEDEQYDKVLDETRKRIGARVHEYLYLADMLKTDVNDIDRFAAIDRTYEQAVKLEEKHNLNERPAIWKYVNYLYYQNEFEKAAEYSKRQLYLLEADNIKEAEIADFSNLISRCFNRLHRYDEAVEMSRKALEIRERLAEEDPVFESALAKTLDGLARLLEIQGVFEEAEKHSIRSIDIYERLTETDAAFLPDLAKSYNNLSEYYVETQRYTETEELCLKALAIHERLAAENPSVYDADLSRSYAELAFLYNTIQRYAEAESLYIKAIVIRKRLAAENPAAFEPDLAAAYIYFSKVYDKTKNWSEGEKVLTKALAITERLAAEQPEAYGFMLLANLSNLARVYNANENHTQAEALYKRALAASEHPVSGEPNSSYTAVISFNLASLLEKTGQFDEAEVFHKKSLEIYEVLVSEKPAVYEPDLAKGYNGLAGLYVTTRRYDEAEMLYKKAVDIRDALVSENPTAFEPDLAKSCHDMAVLYKIGQRNIVAEALFKRALSIRERLAAENPEVFGADLEETRKELASL